MWSPFSTVFAFVLLSFQKEATRELYWTPGAAVIGLRHAHIWYTQQYLLCGGDGRTRTQANH